MTRYRHYRGGIYVIDYIDEKYVNYVDANTWEPFFRTKEEFFGDVTLPSGETVKRFTEINDE